MIMIKKLFAILKKQRMETVENDRHGAVNVYKGLKATGGLGGELDTAGFSSSATTSALVPTLSLPRCC